MLGRREFLIASAGGVLTLAAGGSEVFAGMPMPKSRVSVVRTSDRVAGVPRAIELLGINPVAGKSVLLKPNFNTADPFPASTHNDTLEALIVKLKAMGAGEITVGERSGPPDTADVMAEKGIYDLCKGHGVGVINFEDLPDSDWVRIKPEGTHWRRGFDVARPVLEAGCVVTTSCLKTHGFGGVFTMTLKLSVGITHKRNMTELHTSFRSMRKMIAEINQSYSPGLVLIDGIETFVDGGPSTGVKREGNILLASADRVAADAVGVAVLKELGSNAAIIYKGIFEQTQIKRAAELGLGARGPEEIELVTADGDSESAAYAGVLRKILDKG